MGASIDFPTESAATTQQRAAPADLARSSLLGGAELADLL